MTADILAVFKAVFFFFPSVFDVSGLLTLIFSIGGFTAGDLEPAGLMVGPLLLCTVVDRLLVVDPRPLLLMVL